MANHCRIRDLRPADSRTVARLELESFSDPWSESAILALLDEPTTLALASELAGVLVGYCLARVVGGSAEILDLAVDPGHRRKGVASLMLAEAMTRAGAMGAEEIFLEVRETNQAARSLYGLFGFEVVGLRAAYYRSPSEDALVLRRNLPLVA